MGIKWAVQEIGACSLWKEKYARATTTPCSMSYVLSSIWDWLIQKLAGEKHCPAPSDKDKVPVFGVRESKGQVTTGRETREGIWISHLGGGSMSLKSLISVSGRLTGDPSSCQKDFILFSKELKAGFPDFLLWFQLDLNTINREVEAHMYGWEIPARSSRSGGKHFVI